MSFGSQEKSIYTNLNNNIAPCLTSINSGQWFFRFSKHSTLYPYIQKHVHWALSLHLLMYTNLNILVVVPRTLDAKQCIIIQWFTRIYSKFAIYPYTKIRLRKWHLGQCTSSFHVNANAMRRRFLKIKLIWTYLNFHS